MKFNIGDIVIGNENANHYAVTSEGFIGEVIKIHPPNQYFSFPRIDLRALYEWEDQFTHEIYEVGQVWCCLNDYCFDLYKNPSFSLMSLLKGESQ